MAISPDDLKALEPSAFEQLVAQMLVGSGFRNVVALGGSGDEGIDLRAEWLEELPTGDSRMTVWACRSSGGAAVAASNARRHTVRSATGVTPTLALYEGLQPRTEVGP
jgi:hypothetical protein